MSDGSQHVSDEVILQFIDNELSAKFMQGVREHISVCPECRDRQLAIEKTSNDLVGLYDSERPAANSGATASRVRLQKTLEEHRRHFLWPRAFVAGLSFRRGLTATLLVACMVLVFRGGNRMWESGRRAATAQVQSLIPNRSLTPGAVRPVTLSEVCSDSDWNLDPEVSPSTEKAVFMEYGLSPGQQSKSYQIDYLVNPQLGGTGNIQNLWPESYADNRWNAHAKDHLERRLRQMVCDRSINLEVAQREIATDWIAAYKKYIGSEPS